ncbi:PadR family transcriptional regulator [Sphingobacteriales bacterium UPWRP_1]|nr:PadR family transcriptional regulator [Sphingobacteriales bacterium TSM_CSS]PSJ77650.1 PadR family transcriptional regulator [Sphingobacteriales bacterium UPWRP_1]
MNLNAENSKTQMRRGILELCVLSIIARGEMYPSDIIEEMKRASLLVMEGTLYPLLTRLKNAGLLTYRWEESKAGPPRKYYALTDEGRQFKDELLQTWLELVSAVESVNSPSTTQTNKSHE